MKDANVGKVQRNLENINFRPIATYSEVKKG